GDDRTGIIGVVSRLYLDGLLIAGGIGVGTRDLDRILAVRVQEILVGEIVNRRQIRGPSLLRGRRTAGDGAVAVRNDFQQSAGPDGGRIGELQPSRQN